MREVDEYTEVLNRVRDVVLASARDVSHGRRQRLTETVTSLTDQLVSVARRPDEPDDSADVVKFRKRFSDDRTWYDYVARRAADGHWYLSCRDKRNDKPHTWDELLDFVYDRYGSERTIQVAVEWSYLISRD